MSDFHGIIFAYGAESELGALVERRTSASLPFCGRYRLIDFALSSLANAGVNNVGVIMQQDYQSLLDHLGSGKDWDMNRRHGGLRILPPFGLPEYHTGNYLGTVEALNAVGVYIRDIPQNHVILMHGNVAANIDLDAAIQQHLSSGAEITAVCTRSQTPKAGPRFIIGTDGFAKELLFDHSTGANEVASLETYILSKSLLLDMMEDCKKTNRLHFHRDAMLGYLAEGGKIGIYIHEGYAKPITTTEVYYSANMDMLDQKNRASMFPVSRPVRTKNAEEVSTYYGEDAFCSNSLVADGCIIEGSIKNCILFSAVHIEEGVELEGCIIMKDGIIGKNSKLNAVVTDKNVSVSESTVLSGSPKMPYVVPKGASL